MMTFLIKETDRLIAERLPIRSIHQSGETIVARWLTAPTTEQERRVNELFEGRAVDHQWIPAA